MKKILQFLLWILEGALVGLGAILPGLSGGAMCAAFGLYRPIIEVLSSPFQAIRKYWKLLIFVAVGGAVAIVAFAKVFDYLVALNAPILYCAFAGLVLGTVPELYADAGKKGRDGRSYASMGICFVILLAILLWLRLGVGFSMEPGILGYIVCGLLWGLSFIVPGLSSSNVIMFIGLYEPMNAGIANLDFSVLLPMGIAMLLALLLLSQVMKRALDRFYSIVLHGVIGTVLATTIMILPFFDAGMMQGFEPNFWNIFFLSVAFAGGSVASFFLTRLCGRFKVEEE